MSEDITTNDKKLRQQHEYSHMKYIVILIIIVAILHTTYK